MHLRVAVAHAASESGDCTGNLATIARLADLAGSTGARLLVLPQAFLTGPAEGAASTAKRALLSDSPALRELGRIARTHGIAIVSGYLEACTGRHHDSALFVDDRGCALANYRRTHFVPGDDPGVLARGQWLTVVPWAGRRLGVLIGVDIEAPEPAQALTLAGADALLVLGAIGADLAITGEAVLATRAFENGCALAYASAGIGPGAPRARLLGPCGELLAIAEGELAMAELPPAPPPVRGRRQAERRPQLYQKLAAIPRQEAGPRS